MNDPAVSVVYEEIDRLSGMTAAEIYNDPNFAGEATDAEGTPLRQNIVFIALVAKAANDTEAGTIETLLSLT